MTRSGAKLVHGKGRNHWPEPDSCRKCCELVLLPLVSPPGRWGKGRRPCVCHPGMETGHKRCSAGQYGSPRTVLATPSGFQGVGELLTPAQEARLRGCGAPWAVLLGVRWCRHRCGRIRLPPCGTFPPWRPLNGVLFSSLLGFLRRDPAI